MSPDSPGPVETEFERLREERDAYLLLRNINDRWYVYEATSVWDKAEKKPEKVSTYLGSITPDGEFKPKTPRTNVPVTDREGHV